ncbi:hypothetical protein [Uliginosibacterium sediminicola]|uniref:Baseplate protein J-like domain-containing protein n=1 Tax=Uliginosibacterium sediminicola TaxID=2024550 RepID=A0ABU9YVW5_9RHOO
MKTKDDFLGSIEDLIDNYPTIAALYYAEDPRIKQHLSAIAAMLAMYSAQVESAQLEPFEKVRDATVLADAAMRGIVRKSTAVVVQLGVVNKGPSAFTLEAGRIIIDSSGREYIVEASVTAPAGGSASARARQERLVSVSHTVSGSAPFYAIEISPSDEQESLCSISVSDDDGEYEYRYRYVNTAVAERVYHVEADDRQRVYVRFGAERLVGTQPPDGAVITLQIGYSFGNVSPTHASPFSFADVASAADASIEMTMDQVITSGSDPLSMSVLRDLARYPSVYDDNAVYMGEFDFTVRRAFAGSLQFLSVWNEAAEETARGPNVDNVNAIFVAALSNTGGESVLSGAAAPVLIDNAALTETQQAIKAHIKRADDSYRVHFVTPVRSEIGMTVTATVPTSFIASTVRAQIVDALLEKYGPSSRAAQRGYNRPRYREVYALLQSKVPALSSGNADWKLSIDESQDVSVRPELWRYLSETSLTVTVTSEAGVTPGWS